MSELLEENLKLRQELAQHKQNADGLFAQLDAHKQMLNEQLQFGLNLRTNIVLFQKSNKELSDKCQALEKQVSSLNQQLTDATKKIEELSAPKVEEVQS